VNSIVTTPAVVIGAGPYGLSVAAHLRAKGIRVRVFGEVMSSWRNHMPSGMCLKSTPDASSIAAPAPGFTLADFCAAHGVPQLRENQVVPIELFVRYGQWFQERLVPDVDPRRVCQIDRKDGRFRLSLSSGDDLEAESVVIATGLTSFSYIPPALAAIAPQGPSAAGPVSHSSQHKDLTGFAGRTVAVVGGGQSALEDAALLHEAGAKVTVLVRGTARFGQPPKEPATGLMSLVPEPRSPLGPTWRIYPFSHAPGLFRYLPARTRIKLVKRVLGPLGAWWLRDRVVGRIPVLDGHAVLKAVRDGDKVALSLAGGGARELKVDHVLAATGYRVDLERLGFLGPDLLDQIQTVAGWPRLSRSFESSAPGLFFVGLPAAETFGPVMRFVCGAGFAARRVSAATSHEIL
jgi:FAD-dependent urate hydroxylase